MVNGSPYQSGLLAGIDLEALAASQGENPDIERARQIYAWCHAQNIEVGALAVQFSMREPRISATLVGPRTVAELEDNLRHATASISEAQWAAFAAFLADLQPPAAPGGEAL